MNVKDDDIKRAVLNQLVLAPRAALKPSARNAGIHPSTLFRWIKDSLADPEGSTLEWLGHRQPFFAHVNAARKLNVVAIDHAARDLAINGHSSPKFHDGAPVWKIDPVIAADDRDLMDFEWEAKYPARKRGDLYERDPKTGALIQEMDHSPPNPAILVKLLTSLAPEVYGEKSEVSITHQGHVWIEGANGAAPALLAPPTDFNQTFGLTARPDTIARPTNTLAIPRPCADSAEFDARFRRKLLRDVVLFRNTEGKLLPPFPDDVIVAGSVQARAFEDAGIKVTLVHPTALLDEGYENDFLRELAPNHKRKPPVTPRPAAGVETAPDECSALQAGLDATPSGKASARYDSENLGAGKPSPGGRRVQL